MDLEELRQQWRQSPILRYGALGVVAVVLLYGYLVMSDARTAAIAETERLAERLGRLEALQGEQVWTQRADRARQLRVRIESRLWEADTPGIAQAELQSWLRRQAAQSGMPNPQLSLGEPDAVEGVPGLVAVSAQLEGQFSPDVLRGLLERIETHERHIAIQRLEVRGNRLVIGVRTLMAGPGDGNGG